MEHHAEDWLFPARCRKRENSFCYWIPTDLLLPHQVRPAISLAHILPPMHSSLCLCQMREANGGGEDKKEGMKFSIKSIRRFLTSSKDERRQREKQKLAPCSVSESTSCLEIQAQHSEKEMNDCKLNKHMFVVMFSVLFMVRLWVLDVINTLDF